MAYKQDNMRYFRAGLMAIGSIVLIPICFTAGHAWAAETILTALTQWNSATPFVLLNLSDLIDAQRRTADDMKRASDAFGALVSSAAAFSETAQHLETVTKSLASTLTRAHDSEVALHTVLANMQNVCTGV